MSTPDYADLIARLEKATGPVRELDVAIWAMLSDPKMYRRAAPGPRYSDWESNSTGKWEPFYPALNAKYYTSSIDAKLPGEDQLYWEIEGQKIAWCAAAFVFDPRKQLVGSGYAKTEAIARRIAALKALATLHSNQDHRNEPFRPA